MEKLEVLEKLKECYRKSALNPQFNKIANIAVPRPLREFVTMLFTSDKYVSLKRVVSPFIYDLVDHNFETKSRFDLVDFGHGNHRTRLHLLHRLFGFLLAS